MSISASIKIESEDISLESSFNIIEQFLNSGWIIDDDGNIVYLPLGNDDFEWEVLKSKDKNELFHTLKQKANNKETIGLNITFSNSSIGGNLIINDGELIMILSINRRVIEGLNITDYSWYLNKIPWATLNFNYKRIECIEE